MIATPITAGRLYRVRGFGKTLDVIASNGAHAIALALDFFHHTKE